MAVIIGKLKRPSTHGSSARRKGRRSVHLAGEVTPSRYFEWKAWFDRPVAALLLVPSLPIIGLLVLLVRWNSPGPGLYRQRRLGRNGEEFLLYKIRTMRVDAEHATGAVWAANGDSRVTRLGHYLRRFHLDELPQLFNVLKGEMSLVGPRPERPEFTEVLDQSVTGYEKRVLVSPGVTGLAQLNLPPDSNLCCVCRKTVLDLNYIEHASLLLDLRILACTIASIPKLPWLGTRGVFRLKREVRIAGGCPGNGNSNGHPVTPDEIMCPVRSQLSQEIKADPVAMRMLRRAEEAQAAAARDEGIATTANEARASTVEHAASRKPR